MQPDHRRRGYRRAASLLRSGSRASGRPRRPVRRRAARGRPGADPHDGQWVPGDGPSLAGRWAVEAVAKAGSIGVYSPEFDAYPISQAMNKNLTVRMGNCNHRRYIPTCSTWSRPAWSTPPRSSPSTRTCPGNRCVRDVRPARGRLGEIPCSTSGKAGPCCETAPTRPRWHVEECLQQAKNEAGLDHYQVRCWRAWRAHITLSMPWPGSPLAKPRPSGGSQHPAIQA